MTQYPIGAHLTPHGASFRVWAPKPESVELILLDEPGRTIPMEQMDGYWQALVPGVEAGARYRYRLNRDVERADPASRFQPEGVFGPSQVVADDFAWTDECWFGYPLRQYILYEIHVGTYTTEGTFEAIIPHLPRLKELGVTAIEVLPVAQFPGQHNWGYDGVFPFAPQNSYGGPVGLKRLIDAAHAHGLAVVLDVVYNHLGPEGNFFADFGPYFTEAYKTPWGAAINYDGEYCDPVRDFVIQNALYWIREFHVDSLRLDACHLLFDNSANHILSELKAATLNLALQLNRQVFIFGETDNNDIRYARSWELGGLNLDNLWCDDFHHALFVSLEKTIYDNYAGEYLPGDLLKSYTEGYVYTGQYSPGRKKRHGKSSRDLAGEAFLVFIQNHDQIGNKPTGTRLGQEVSFEALKLAAAAYLLSPYIPLIFMGEEHNDASPFMYFVDYEDENLRRATQKGRDRDFNWPGYTMHLAADPETFKKSKLTHLQPGDEKGAVLWKYYQTLITLRRSLPALADLNKQNIRLLPEADQTLLAVERGSLFGSVIMLLNLSPTPRTVNLTLRHPWHQLLQSADSQWLGPGSPAPAMLVPDEQGQVQLTLAPESATLYQAQPA